MLIPSSLIMFAMIQVLIPGSQANTYEAKSTVTPSRGCGEGWHTVGEQCFKWVTSKVTNWYGASAECENLGTGTHLAQPRDIAQLAQYMDGEGIAGGGPWDKWLIGARTVFRWDNGEEIANEAPVNNCVILTWLNNFHPRLKSFSCTSKGWSYICEKGACPRGFEEKNGNCYFFSSSVGTKVTWLQAKRLCEINGNNFHLAELGNPNNLASDEWLLRKIKDKGHNSIWLGAHNPNRNGNWTWSHSGRNLAITFPFWAQDEPNNKGGDEKCVSAAWFGKHRRYYLNDAPCNTENYYVCQISK